MKRLLLIILAAVLGLSAVSCSSYSDINDTLNEHENRLNTLEENLKALETLLSVIESSDYITSVKVVVEGGKEVGYSITFAKNGTIVIYHGSNGADGADGANGSNGSNSGDSIFREVFQKDNYMVFVLNDGTVYKVPLSAQTSSTALDIKFDIEPGLTLEPYVDYQIPYVITGGDDKTTVRVITNDYYVSASVEALTSSTGCIRVRITQPFYGQEIEHYFSQFTVMVTVQDGKNNSTVKAINISPEVFVVNAPNFDVDAEGGRVYVYIDTTLEYDVEVPYSWIECIPDTKSELRTDVIIFDIEPNEGRYRSALIKIKDKKGDLLESIVINQESSNQESFYPIKIDGEFSDWDALDPEWVSVATCDPDASWTALSVLKACATTEALYIYFEFDENQIPDRSWVPFHIFLDADASAETGGFGDQYAEAACEWCLEGAVFADGEFCSYDGVLFPWIGEVGANGWEWGDSLYSGFTTGAGAGNKYELVLIKWLCKDIVWGETCGIGVDIQQTWNSVGVLPNSTPTDDNSWGRAPLLRVRVVDHIPQQ